MRPDFVRQQYCPNLYSLATNGVFFRRNHCAYVSTTIVNGTVLARGTYPGHSGILANSDFREELNSQTSIASEVLETVRRVDLISGGKYVAVDTVAELIQAAGHYTYIAGTKSVTLLHDRSLRCEDTEAHRKSVTLGCGLSLPRAATERMNKANDDKVFPNTDTIPNVASDTWTIKALTHGLWKNGVPKYSLLWLSDPDKTQHAKGVGAPESLAAIEASDKNLGEVLKVLEQKGIRGKTDLMVVSDHGFSSVARGGDIPGALRRAGLNAHTKLENPEPGDVVVVELGGSALIYVIDHREDVIRKAATVLQGCDFSGVIFSRIELEGTFPLSTVKYPTDGHAPDLVVSMRWTDDKNDFGAPGYMMATGGTRGTGAHGSLSRFEMNNTLVATGPSFKRGFVSKTPSGNIDIAPTILHLLGITRPDSMDGRVLKEALAGNGAPAPELRERKLEASRTVGFLRWDQYLRICDIEGVSYFASSAESVGGWRYR
ncbi:MAG: hypothetical protein EXS36_18690 [Pedosphaera sp.]|nr:hypothetical protein [Pedosphaera sp.]